MSIEELFNAEPAPKSEWVMPRFAVTEDSALNIVISIKNRVESGQGRTFTINCKRAIHVSETFIETLINGVCAQEQVTLVFTNSFRRIRELGADISRRYEVGWLVEYA